jgi:hypothetical protein
MRGPAETMAERVARNQSTFREANERIERAAGQLVADVDPLPFICECAREDCTELTALSPQEYEAIRSDGRRFLVARGHETCEVNGETVAKVVERRPLFSVLEKVGEAGEFARELDPRR